MFQVLHVKCNVSGRKKEVKCSKVCNSHRFDKVGNEVHCFAPKWIQKMNLLIKEESKHNYKLD